MTTSPQADRRTDRRPDRPTVERDPSDAAPAAFVAVRRIFAAETGNFFLLLGTTLFLVVFGLVMVLSASSVTSFTENDDFFSVFLRQWIFVAVGIPIMLIASRMPSSFWKRWAGVAMIVGIVLQLLVVATPLGVNVNGNRNWLNLGGVTIQPSEITKVALVIWLAYILSRKSDRLNDLKEVTFPIAPFAGLAIVLVLLGHDLGTALILVAIVLGAMFFAGVRLRILAIPVAIAAVAVPMLGLSSNSRSDRLNVWLDQCASIVDQQGACWQTVHGWWALASGGFFGVGLGNSASKWSWLPEADNDFIFAIIGEEFGLLGAITVLVLFVVLAIAFVRIIRANTDPFARIAVSAVLVWVIGQAFINIAVVLGVLPVLGVPLPLMSAGGSAMLTTLFAIGIVLSFARHPVRRDEFEPQQSAQSSARPRTTGRQRR